MYSEESESPGIVGPALVEWVRAQKSARAPATPHTLALLPQPLSLLHLFKHLPDHLATSRGNTTITSTRLRPVHFPLDASPFLQPLCTMTVEPHQLATTLSQPLTSTTQLFSLLIPPLVQLNLLSDQPHLTSLIPPSPSTSTTTFDPPRFLKRQLALVQKVLIEKVWPDWETTLEAEEGTTALLVFERWFVPPPPSKDNDSNSKYAGDVAISSYAILSSLLSIKRTTTSSIQPRSLEIITSLLVKLSQQFNLEQVYLAVHSKPSEKNCNGNEDMTWEATWKDLRNVPTRVANAWGALEDGKVQGRIGDGVPLELEPLYVLKLLSSCSSAPR